MSKEAPTCRRPDPSQRQDGSQDSACRVGMQHWRSRCHCRMEQTMVFYTRQKSAMKIYIRNLQLRHTSLVGPYRDFITVERLERCLAIAIVNILNRTHVLFL